MGIYKLGEKNMRFKFIIKNEIRLLDWDGQRALYRQVVPSLRLAHFSLIIKSVEYWIMEYDDIKYNEMEHPWNLKKMDEMETEKKIRIVPWSEVIYTDIAVRKNKNNISIYPDDYKDFFEKWKLAMEIDEKAKIMNYTWMESLKFLITLPYDNLLDKLREVNKEIDIHENQNYYHR